MGIKLREVGSIIVGNHIINGEATDVLEITVINDDEYKNEHENEHENEDSVKRTDIFENAEEKNTNEKIKQRQQTEEKLYFKWLDGNDDVIIRTSQRGEWIAALHTVHKRVTKIINKKGNVI